MIVVSVPASVKKNISTLFLPCKAVNFDLENRNAVLGCALQSDHDGLFYFGEDERSSTPFAASLTKSETVFVAHDSKVTKNESNSLTAVEKKSTAPPINAESETENVATL